MAGFLQGGFHISVVLPSRNEINPFSAGINSLKLDEMAGGVAAKFTSAKEFVAEMSPIRNVREKVGNLIPNNVVNFTHYLSTYMDRSIEVPLRSWYNKEKPDH